MKISTFIGITLLAVSGATLAQTEEQKFAYEFCQATAVTTTEVTACIYDEYKLQDDRLQTAYKKLDAAASKQRKSQLKVAQTNWTKYKDTNCKFAADPNGSADPLINLNICILNMTVSRAKELERLVY